MRGNNYFANYNQMTPSQKRDHCEFIINDCNYWLERTSNPQKIRFRKKWIKSAEQELAILDQDQPEVDKEDFPF